MQYEIPIIRKVIEQHGAKLVYILPNKQHETKLFPTTEPRVAQGQTLKAPDANINIGTCIDRDITNAFVPEFFLLGHFPRLVNRQSEIKFEECNRLYILGHGACSTLRRSRQ